MIFIGPKRRETKVLVSNDAMLMMMAMPKEHNFALFIISQSILLYILHCYNAYYCHRPQCFSSQTESIVVEVRLLFILILLLLHFRVLFVRRCFVPLSQSALNILSVYFQFARCYRCM